MIKKSSVCIASILVLISLLTETAYRFLSLKTTETTETTTEAAVGKNCVVLVFGRPTQEDGTLHPMQRFRVEAGIAVYQQQQCRQIIFPAAQLGTDMLRGRRWRRMHVPLVCRRVLLRWSRTRAQPGKTSAVQQPIWKQQSASSLCPTVFMPTGQSAMPAARVQVFAQKAELPEQILQPRS